MKNGGGSGTTPAQWVYVFGWTEKEMVKKVVQSLLLEEPINDNLIPHIKEQIQRHYVIKDWHKFDYISIEPPHWSIWTYIIVMLVTQAGLYIFFHMNDEYFQTGRGYDKNSEFMAKLQSMFTHWPY